MKIEDLLPIGSVILLEEGEKRLMIYGVKQTEQDTQTEYDYIGVVYPEGNMGQGTQFLFNHDQIKEIYFKGFEDQERQEFIARLSDYYEQRSQADK